MAKRRKAVGKMKRTTAKKTPKRLAAKKERIEELAKKRATTGNMKGCKNARDAKKAGAKLSGMSKKPAKK